MKKKPLVVAIQTALLLAAGSASTHTFANVIPNQSNAYQEKSSAVISLSLRKKEDDKDDKDDKKDKDNSDIVLLDVEGIKALSTDDFASYTGEQFILFIEQLTKLSDELDDETKALVFFSLDQTQFQTLFVSGFEGKHGKDYKKVEKELKKELTDFYKAYLPPGIKADVKVKEDKKTKVLEVEVKFKLDKKQLKDKHLTYMTPAFFYWLDWEGMKKSDVEYLLELMPQTVTTSVTEQDIDIWIEGGTPDVDNELDNEFADLDATAISHWSLEDIAALTSDDLAAIPITAFSGFTKAQIAALDITIVRLLTLEQVLAFSSEALAGFNADNVVGLSTDILEALGIQILMSMEADEVQKLVLSDQPDVLTWLASDSNVLGWIVLNYFDVIRDAEDTDINDFLPEGWTLITVQDNETTQYKLLLTEAAVNALSLDLIASLTVDQFVLFNVTSISYLSVTQVKVIKQETFVALPQDYVVQLPEVPLDEIDFSTLDATAVSELSLEVIANLDADQLAMIPIEAFSGFTQAQIAAFDVTIVEQLTLTQVLAFSPEALSGFNADNVIGLSTEIVQTLGLKILKSLEITEVQKLVLSTDDSVLAWLSSDSNLLAWLVLNYYDATEGNINVCVVDDDDNDNDRSRSSDDDDDDEGNSSDDDDDDDDEGNSSDDDDDDDDEGNSSDDDDDEGNSSDDDDDEGNSSDDEDDDNDDNGNSSNNDDANDVTCTTASIDKFLPPDWTVVTLEDGTLQFLLTEAAVQTLSFDLIASLTAKQFFWLDATLMGYLSADQIDAIDDGTLAGLSENYLEFLLVEETVQTLPTVDLITLLTKLFVVQAPVIETRLVEIVVKQPIIHRVNITLNMINSGNTAQFNQIALPGWTFEDNTGKVELTQEAVSELSTEVITNFTDKQIVQFQPTVFNHLTVNQFANLSPLALGSVTRKQMTNLNIKVIEKFTATQVTHLNHDSLGGLSLEQFELIPADARKGLTVTNIGGLAPEVIFAKGPELFNTITVKEEEKLSLTDAIKIISSVDATKVKSTDLEKFLPIGVKIDHKTGKLKFKKGKVKLPKWVRKLELPTAIVLPELPDLNVSFSLGGSLTQKTVLTELTQTLATIGYSGFAFKQQDSGILTVEGQGSSFAFIPAQDGLEQLAEGTATPGLTATKTGHYEFITADSQKVTLIPMPVNVQGLLDVVGEGGKVEINEHGETHLQIQVASGKFSQVAGVFEADVETAEAGAAPGITITGTPGVDEVAICVYKDGSKQTIRPAILDRDISEIAAPQVTGNQRLNYQYHANGEIHFDLEGFRWKAVPELTVTTVATRKQHLMKVLKPSELVEFITKEGQRQLLHIEQIGEALGSDDSENDTDD